MVLCAPCIAQGFNIAGTILAGSVGAIGIKNSLKDKKKKKTAGIKKKKTAIIKKKKTARIKKKGTKKKIKKKAKKKRKMKGGSLNSERGSKLLNIKRKQYEKDCTLLYDLLKKKKIIPDTSYGEIVNNNKIKCYWGNDKACNFCKDEYLKNLKTDKKFIMTPLVPEEALPKKKQKTQKTQKTQKKSKRRRNSVNESNELLIYAAHMNSKKTNSRSNSKKSTSQSTKKSSKKSTTQGSKKSTNQGTRSPLPLPRGRKKNTSQVKKNNQNNFKWSKSIGGSKRRNH